MQRKNADRHEDVVQQRDDRTDGEGKLEAEGDEN